MRYTNIDPTERNPIYPGALRLCDVRRGVPYRTINVRYGDDTGVFCSKPFFSKRFPGPPDLAAKTITIISVNNKKIKDELCLTSAGIAQSNDGGEVWNRFNFTIKNTPADFKLYQDWLDSGGDKIIKDAANLLDYYNSLAESLGVFDDEEGKDDVEE